MSSSTGVSVPQQSSASNLKLILSAAVFLGICFLAYLGARSAAPGTDGAKWYAVIPPVLAVTLAFATQRLMLSLGSAIFVGGILAKVPGDLSAAAWGKGIVAAPLQVWTSISDPFNIKVLVFVTIVLSMISVVVTAGGLQAVVSWLEKFAKGPRSTQLVTALMGVAIFIDDYANTMIVGTSMRPATDRHHVSREKLSFLVDATSAPVAGLAVISTWIGYEVGLFGKVSETLSLGRDGYSMFFDAISFRFYCIFMILFLFIQIFTGRDYGPMADAEERARKKKKVFADDAVPLSQSAASAGPDAQARIKMRTALIPFGALFAALFVGLWIDGGGLDVLNRSPFAMLGFTAWREVISASENNVMVLAVAAAIGLVVATIMGVTTAGLKFDRLAKAAFSGARASLLPIGILVLAWSLKGICDQVGTGGYLVAAVSDKISPALFPAVLFLVSGLTAFATGTSWGTMAILIPTAIPVAHQLDGAAYGMVTIMSLGAVLDGAIFGDHCSPISDTTLMSSIASGCDHIHHVKTQLPYALTAATVALGAGYLPVAYGLPTILGFAIGIGAMFAVFYLFGRPIDGAGKGKRT